MNDDNNIKIEINIDLNPLPFSIEKSIKKLSVVRGDYGKIPVEKIKKIAQNDKLRKLKIKNIDLLIILIRQAYIKEGILTNYKRLSQLSSKLYRQFKSGQSVIKLSKKYDFAPLMLSRQILKEKGHNKKQVKKFMKRPESISDERLRNDIIKIKKEELDMFTQANKDESAKKADEFEIKLGKLLTRHGVRFKTQEELVEEQIKLYGKPINTPDFLILDDLRINGYKIGWLDAKNFYGARSWFIRLSIEKQIKKYVNEWGTGAIVFSMGYSDELDISEDVMLIDYDSFDTSKNIIKIKN